jgi:hypothetical protein
MDDLFGILITKLSSFSFMEDDYPGFFELSPDERWFKEKVVKFAKRLRKRFRKFRQE